MEAGSAPPAANAPPGSPSGDRRSVRLVAASLLLLAAGGFVFRGVCNYAADVGGIRWLPRPLSRLINPPLPELRPPPPPPKPVREIVPGEPGVLAEDSLDQLQAGAVPAWRHPAAIQSGESQPAASVTDWQAFSLPAAVRWQTPLVVTGTATPIVLNDMVLLTGVDPSETLWLVAHAVADGSRLWQTKITSGGFPSRHGKTSDAASTPCCDGRQIYVAWVNDHTAWLAAFSLAGEPRWQTALGRFAATHGFASSPALSHGLVLLNVDNGPQSFMVAVQATTGEIRWRRKRPAHGDGSYSSPVVVAQPAPAQPVESDPADPSAALFTPATIVSGLEAIECRRLADGELLWQAGGIASVSAITPLIADGICVAGSGFPERVLLALKLDEFDEPKISETAGRVVTTGPTPKLLWRETKSSEVPYVPSPVVKEGRLYLVHDDGLAHCRDLTTGNVLWKRRVGGSFTASPILIGNTMLCVSETGACSLLALKDGEILQQFQLPGGCFATPRLLADSLLFRTTADLLCIKLPVVASPNHR